MKDDSVLYVRRQNGKYKTFDRVGDVVPHNTRYDDIDYETLDAMYTIRAQLNKLILYENYRTGGRDMIAYYMGKAVEYCDQMIKEVKDRM